MNGLLIALSLEYGAEEYLWYSSFQTKEELLSWWRELKTTDIYENKLEDILNVSELVLVNSEELQEVFYSIPKLPKIMLENDPCSYLIIDGQRYAFSYSS